MHTPESPLKQCIVHTDEIVLPYDQANISFDVALLSYSTAESNQYYYRMEPLDRDWVRAASNQNISYAKLPRENTPSVCRLLTAVSPSRPHVLCLLSFFLRGGSLSSLTLYIPYALS